MTRNSQSSDQTDGETPEGVLTQESLLAERLAYDEHIQRGNVEARFDQSDGEFARTVRLLHETLGMAIPRDDGGATPEGLTAFDELPNPFGRFQIERQIGSGAFGVVWEGHDPLLQRNVAIKVPHFEIRSDPEIARRFLTEARAAARLNHPNIVRVLDAGQIQGIAYMATELVTGESLSEFLKRRGRLDVREAAKIIQQISDAVHHGHQHGVLHRDIKPDNILLDPVLHGTNQCETIPRLTDFGLAKLADDESGRSHAGLLIGTPDYMAPEQANGTSDRNRPATDVFSLGVILIELLTGRLIRDERTDVSPLVAVAIRRIESPRGRCPDIPRDLDSICLHAVERDPARRYQSAAALRDDLDRFLSGQPTVARPLPLYEQCVRWSADHRTATVALLTILVALITVCGLIWNDNRRATIQNGLLREALTEGDTARRRAIQSEDRYRILAWNTGLAHAYTRYDHGDLPGTRHALDALRDSHPQAEFQPEWALLHAELSSRFHVLRAVDYPIYDAVPIPGTHLISFAGSDQHVELFNTVTGTTQARLLTGIRQIHALAASTDGSFLAAGGTVGSDDKAVPWMIHLSTNEIHPLTDSNSTTIESLAFSPDGSRLAVGPRYDAVNVLNIDGDTKDTELSISADRRNKSLFWHGQPRVLISQRDLTTLQITDLQDDKPPRSITRDAGFHAFAGFPNQDKLLAVHYRGDHLEVININDGTSALMLTGSTGKCECVGISADEQWAAAGLVDGRIAVWPLGDASANIDSTVNAFSVRQIHDGRVTSLNWHGSSVISVGEDGHVVQWSPIDSNTAEMPRAVKITAACLLPRSDDVLLGFQDGNVRVAAMSLLERTTRKSGSDSITRWDSASKVVAETGHTITALAVTSDGRTMAVGSLDGSLSVISRDSPLQSRIVPSRPNRADDGVSIRHLAFSPTADQLFWTGDDGVLHCAWLNGRANGHTHSLPSAGHYVCVSPDGRLVAVGGNFEGVNLFDPRSGNASEHHVGTDSTKAFAFSNDGGVFCTGNADGTIRCYKAFDFSRVSILRTHSTAIADVALHPETACGISVDSASGIGVWNSDGVLYGSLRSPTTMEGLHENNVQPKVAFSDNGKWLLTLTETNDHATEVSVHRLKP